jgi:hypothetical protein
MSRRAIQSLVVLSLMGVVGGGLWWWNPFERGAPDDPNGEPRDPPAETSATGRADRPLYLSELARPGSTTEVLVDDPRTDGWDTEAFSRAAGGQLKKLSALITQRGAVMPVDGDKLVTAEFACPGLRPRERRVAYRGRTLGVSRGVNLGNAAADEGAHGTQRLATVVRELIEPFTPEQRMRAAVKVVGVTNHDDAVTTEVLFQLSGLASGGSLQQNAHWTCRWTPIANTDSPPRLLSIQVSDYEEIVSRGKSHTLLMDCTEAVMGHTTAFREQLAPGVPYWLDRLDLSVTHPDDVRSGLAVGDVDGDGLDDLYVCQPVGLPNRLFLQNNDGTVREQAAARGVDWLDQTRSALLIDLDNDGDQDLVSAIGNDLIFHSNDGSGHFTKRAALPLKRPGTSLVATDYDHDGDIDVFACVYYSADRHPGELMDPIPYYDARNGGRNILFRNDISGDGLWTFTDVTEEVGMDQENSRWSLAAAWEDYDNDGDQDLYVANDFGRNNLYRNDVGPNGRRVFTDVAAEAGAEDAAFGMSVSWADYNHDGWMDVYISNMFTAAGNRISYQRQFQEGIDEETKGKYQHLARGNTLFQGTRQETFRDVSVKAGVTMARWAWASQFLDINNDGWEDLFVCNGYLTNPMKDDL